MTTRNGGDPGIVLAEAEAVGIKTATQRTANRHERPTDG
jgi:hypothetical protein